MKITNPILRGFNPDPSIVRVGDDYYIATSTFEWYPGVQIHHSRDLAHWRLLTRPAQPREPARYARRSRFLRRLGAVPDLRQRAVPPDLYRREALRPDFGRRRIGASLRDMHNYLVTAEPSTATGPIRCTSTPAASTPRCSRTTTAASNRQHALGLAARAQPLRRHRAAGILGRGGADRRAATDFPRHATRLHRRAAHLQARRLVSICSPPRAARAGAMR